MTTSISSKALWNNKKNISRKENGKKKVPRKKNHDGKKSRNHLPIIKYLPNRQADGQDI